MSSTSFPILLVGRAQQMSMEQMYLRAFQANGCREVNLLDIEADRPAWSRNRLVNRFLPRAGHAWASQRLLTHLRGCNDRYRWIIIFKGMEYSRHVLEECRKLAPAALWINVNPDDPYNVAARGASNSNVLESLSFFDAYCIWSRSIADRLRADGCNRVIYLPFGYDETYHVPHEGPSRTDPALILFFGTWDKEREAILARLARYNVSIHGAGWERAARGFPLIGRASGQYAFGPTVAPIIASSAICLNLLRQQNRGAHNMRTFEIPAMGGLMLTNRTAQQHEFFPENEACYMYADIAELKSKIEYILTNKQDADRVRARGMELVREHSLTNRAQFILRELAR
jgi:spore maturation protein CgeB